MSKEICVLFDMDGVMIDTEPQYDVFWKHAGDKYNAGIANFEKVIKGTTLHGILQKYFSHLSKEETNNLVESLDKFESEMKFTEIPGAVKFVETLKSKGIKVGLVTSSMDIKLEAVNKVRHFDKLFDTIVSGNRVSKGKPDPECFLLAAKELNADPKNCIVFEDSFAGIAAGQAAGMKVVGLSTTHAEEAIKEKGVKVIPNFEDLDDSFVLSL